MKRIPLTVETERVARHIIWFEEPERALQDTARFLAYAMRYGTIEDLEVINRFLSEDDLREALDKAPPGVMDPRSWAYWNARFGRFPAPAMPTRKLR
jgi:hypothetical protein